MELTDIKNESRNFKSLFDFIPGAVFTIGLDYKIIDWNKYAEELTGFTGDEMRGSDCMNFTVDPCDFRCCTPDGSGNPIYKNICRIRTKNGIVKTISKKVENLYDDGKLKGYIEIFEDLSYSESLYDELIMYLTAIEQSANVIVITDTRGNIVYVNEAFEKTTGYIKTESIGNNPRILKTDLHDDSFYKDLWKTISSGNNWNGIFRNRRKDGSEYWEKAVISPVKGRNGSIIYYLAIKEDITENVEKEKKLNELLVEYETIFNNNAYGLVLMEKSGVIRNVNRHFKEMTGYSVKEIKDVNFTEIFFSGLFYKNQSFSEIIGSLERGSVISMEEKFSKKNGNLLWMAITAKAIEHTDMILWSFYDITKRKHLEEYKKSINQIMHHDLRSPVASIIAITDQIIHFGKDVDDENKRLIMMISDVGKSMINQMNTFLSMSKIEEGIYKYHPVRINLAKNIKNAVSMIDTIRNFKDRNGINIIIEYNGKRLEEHTAIYVDSDENLFNSILINLIKNAVEASPDGKDITISVDDRNDFIISIHNFGSIPQNIRGNLFEKYSTSGKTSGTGIGLYGVKIMSEAMGARISLSTDDEKGTAIYLNFGRN
jgi:PAS domain S-box-containing protein